MEAKIAEIFKSIQGEGIYQGYQQVFVRFFGCNLRCSFCDTGLFYYRKMSLDEVMDKIISYQDYHSVSLTGGEPLLQVEFLKELTRRLKDKNKIIYLETNGTLYQNLSEIIEHIDIIAMDFKFPSSTGLLSLWRKHEEFLKIAQDKEIFIKAVISPVTREEDIFSALALVQELGQNLIFVLQPQNPFEEVLKGKLKYFQEICESRHINTKVILQLHKQLSVK